VLALAAEASFPLVLGLDLCLEGGLWLFLLLDVAEEVVEEDQLGGIATVLVSVLGQHATACSQSALLPEQPQRWKPLPLLFLALVLGAEHLSELLCEPLVKEHLSGRKGVVYGVEEEGLL
jgi:hypothetical protein